MSSHYSAVELLGSAASSFQILARIARGGMAEIFLARAATGGGVARHVVLKRVTRDRAHDHHFLRMFLDEARLAAQLQHPNIAQVYDVGKLGDSYFFTMEYVHGETVRAIVQRLTDRGDPVPVVCALTIAAGAAAGLHHAHERIGVDGRPLGIVHRDVSPSNLMVSFEGNVKVVDFGVAQATTRDHETVSGTVKGKIAYLSPEQATGSALDRRSDIFSLGIVMWEMLTGRRLYKRSSDFASMSAIVSEPVEPPSSIRPEVPAAVDAIVARALAKDRNDRFESAHELHEAIEAVAAAHGHALSVAALARFVRELCGPRPEPWIALERPTGAHVVTLTAEPIPQNLIVPPASAVDQQLASVVDLETLSSIEPTARRAITDASDVTELPTAAPTRRWRWPALGLGLALAAGVALGVALGFSGPEHIAPDAGAPAVANAIAADASIAPPEPAEPAANATEAGAPAAEPAAANATDAGTAPEPAPEPDVVPTDPVRRAQSPQPPTDRALVSQCASGLASRKAASCVLAACRLRDVEQARTWFAGVPATQRAAISTRCRASRVEVAPKDIACEADPSRCQF